MEDQISTVANDENEGKSIPCSDSAETASLGNLSRKEKRKALKKMKRKQVRKEMAEREKEEAEARDNDEEEKSREEERERKESERREKELREFEERERKFLEEIEMRKKKEEEEEREKKALEDEKREKHEKEESDEDDNWEYVEEGPAEIIWQGNEITVRKKKVKVPKKNGDNANRPTSNPLPPQSQAFSDYINASALPARGALENMAQQVPNFGTEQDKAHCPFHLKTGACRFGQRCSRVHFYPDKSCTLVMKNMYNGPGLAWEQDEGLEVCKYCPCMVIYTDEEVDRTFEEFYEDVHTEFLKFGEIVNFKVCKNGSSHLRGNVYLHYKSLDSAVLAYQSFNGRYYAGKQLKCEYVNITRWKVAICGEYMKSRLQTCSRGNTCNFIHCFRNPGGDYEWADWDKPPPRYWVKKMAALFGYYESPGSEKLTEKDMGQLSSSAKMITSDMYRCHSRRSRSRERDRLGDSSRRSYRDEDDGDRKSSTLRRRRASDDRERHKVSQGNASEYNSDLRENYHCKRRTSDIDTDEEWRDRDKYHSHRRRSSKLRKEGFEHSSSFLDGSRIQESDSDKSLCDRHEKREAHEKHPRKSSRCHTEECLDDKDSEADHLSKDRDKERHHNCNRKSLRHHSELQYQEEFESSKESHYRESVGGQSKMDRDWHCEYRSKRSKCEDQYSELLDDDRGRESTLDTVSSDDQSHGGKERYHSNTRKSSRHRNKLQNSDDHEDHKKKKHRIDSLEEQPHRGNEGDRHQSHRRKSSKHRHKYSSNAQSDRERERHHNLKSKHPRHWEEEVEFSNSKDEPLKKLKDAFVTEESNMEKLNSERLTGHRQSGRSCSRGNIEEAVGFVDCPDSNRDHESTFLGDYDEKYVSRYNMENSDNNRWEMQYC